MELRSFNVDIDNIVDAIGIQTIDGTWLHNVYNLMVNVWSVLLVLLECLQI